MKKFLLLLAALTLSVPARADTFVDAQHAGYAGNAALGLGYAGSSFGIDGLYGFTPKRLAGHDVRSFTLKGLWYLFSVGYPSEVNVRPYLGLGAIYSPDHDLFLQLPKQYPDSYYVPSALRPALLMGLRTQINLDWSVSLEYVLLDSELAYVKNKGGVAYDQVGSVGFGIHYNLTAH